jgi:hypothetical protein
MSLRLQEPANDLLQEPLDLLELPGLPLPVQERAIIAYALRPQTPELRLSHINHQPDTEVPDSADEDDRVESSGDLSPEQNIPEPDHGSPQTPRHRTNPHNLSRDDRVRVMLLYSLGWRYASIATIRRCLSKVLANAKNATFLGTHTNLLTRTKINQRSSRKYTSLLLYGSKYRYRDSSISCCS